MEKSIFSGYDNYEIERVLKRRDLNLGMIVPPYASDLGFKIIGERYDDASESDSRIRKLTSKEVSNAMRDIDWELLFELMPMLLDSGITTEDMLSVINAEGFRFGLKDDMPSLRMGMWRAFLLIGHGADIEAVRSTVCIECRDKFDALLLAAIASSGIRRCY